MLFDTLSRCGPRLSRPFTSGIVKWGINDTRDIERWDARLRRIAHTSALAVRRDCASTPADALPAAVRDAGYPRLRPTQPVRIVGRSSRGGFGHRVGPAAVYEVVGCYRSKIVAVAARRRPKGRRTAASTTRAATRPMQSRPEPAPAATTALLGGPTAVDRRPTSRLGNPLPSPRTGCPHC